MNLRKPLRILFVARPVSIHAARWINQVADQGWDLHMFSAYQAPFHADFRNLTTYSLKLYAKPKTSGVPQRALRARVSVGLSISDGLSTSALEAMVMGAFSVQSATSCLTELVRDGEGVLVVPAEEQELVAAAIRRAVTEDGLVDRAADLNTRIVTERLDQERICHQVVSMYERIGSLSNRRDQAWEALRKHKRHFNFCIIDRFLKTGMASSEVGTQNNKGIHGGCPKFPPIYDRSVLLSFV